MDGDGVIDTEDTGLGGVIIFIDLDGSGTFNAGDESTTTATDGTWSFTNLDYSDAGNKVYEVLPSGYVQTLGAAGYTITGTSGTDQTGLNFANFELINISGYKWADLDADGTWNEPDAAVLQGWTIYLDNDNDLSNGYIDSAVTDANGYYEFTNIGPTDFGNDADGILHVYEEVQAGFIQTYGDYSFEISSGFVIEATLGATEKGNFGNNMLQGANRTPGFWKSTLGQSLWNGVSDDQGDANGDGIPDGDKDFEEEGWCEEDLLEVFGIDLEGGDGINDHFLVWDEGGNGYQEGSDDIALSVDELLVWLQGGDGKGRDYVETLQRDVAAAYLNTLNNTCLSGGHGSPVFDPEITDSYEAAVQFILNAPQGKKQQRALWKSYGSDAHIELAAYNENGEAMIDGSLTQIAMDGDDYNCDAVQNYLAAEKDCSQYYASLLYDPFLDEDELFDN